MNLLKTVKKLCTPALLYFSISILAFIVMLLQNYGNNSEYHLGSYACETEYLPVIFMVKLLYIAFWTFILNLICKAGFTYFSWFLVLLPFISMFILSFLTILLHNTKESFEEGMDHEMEEAVMDDLFDDEDNLTTEDVEDIADAADQITDYVNTM